ncbi:MAG: F0F1 ATP synthase subunit A [Alphaproteobacteria bacterium]
MSISIGEPLHQFEIQTIIPLELGGFDISFTNSTLWMMIAIAVSFTAIMLATRRLSPVPNRFQAFVEIVYEIVADMLRSQVGQKGMVYFPFIFSIFVTVLMGNVLGLIPHSFTYTSHWAATGTLALIVIGTVTTVGFLRHGLHFFSLFLPSGVPWWLAPVIVPLEMISYMIRPVSLSLRLFINMMVGHIVIKAFAGICASIGIFGLLPAAVNVAIFSLEMIIALVQTYIFVILSCIYMKDAVDLH